MPRVHEISIGYTQKNCIQGITSIVSLSKLCKVKTTAQNYLKIYLNTSQAMGIRLAKKTKWFKNWPVEGPSVNKGSFWKRDSLLAPSIGIFFFTKRNSIALKIFMQILNRIYYQLLYSKSFTNSNPHLRMFMQVTNKG